MSYKTILLHLNDERRARNVLAHAIALARTFQAHLIGLHVFPAYQLTPPVRLPIGANPGGNIRRQIHEETDRIKAAFQLETANQSFHTEWRSVTTERVDPATVVLAHGRAADLIVASQAEPTWDFSSILDFPERLAIESGRPVLVVPNGDWTTPLPPRTITVGWNGRRESARAVFDALPFLKMAEQVHVLTVEEGQDHQHGLPDAAFADALRRHGVKVEISKVKSTKSAGEEIRERALEQRADLLVLGAYGHSRFLEFAFGGVTRHILRTMTIPALFAH